MDSQEYKKIIKQIKIGKQLPDAVYLHQSALKDLPEKLLQLLNSVIKHQKLEQEPWNIIKFFKRNFKLSLLYYPEFFEHPFPALEMSRSINLESEKCQKTQYKNSKNPPILHRKETFLLSTHPAVPYFQKITETAENNGLFQNTHIIGFKKGWENLLYEKGLMVQGNALVKIDERLKNSKIDRHRTAIDRNSLSTPVQSLYRNNYLNGDYTIFDYGCGKGDDLNILKDHGVHASGWDPAYYSSKKLQKADIVNLGFVLNIIESPNERVQTLKKAYSLSKKLLVTSVMLGSESITNKFKPYADGVVTSRNTFQKYYTQREFREYLKSSLNESVIAVGPGLFYLFKDKIEEQQFLVDRQKRKRHWQKLSYTDTPERAKIKKKAIFERHKLLLNDFWDNCLELGRIPLNSEYKQSEDLRTICGSHQKSFALLSTIHDLSIFKDAELDRRNDLLVHFALSLFSQRKPYKEMPKFLQKDIKHFFGKYTEAVEEARALLFSVGNTSTIKSKCEKDYQKFQKGRLDKGHSWTIHIDYINQLSPILRTYIGCATQLYGDLHEVDLIKIHMQSNKISLMRYDNFAGNPLPLLLERIKINLREQRIDFFSYGENFTPQPLYLKSQYLPKNYLHYEKQCKFDCILKDLQWLDIQNFGPNIEDFSDTLAKKEGLKIDKFKFVKTELLN